MNLKEFFTRHLRGWFPEEPKMPENVIYALIGRYYMSTRLSDFIRFLSNISIGIGLAYTSMLGVMALSLFFPVTNVTGTIASLVSIIAIGSTYLYVYRKSFNVDLLLILKFCLSAFFITPFSFYLIPIFLFKEFFLPVISLASAFLAIGLVGIYGYEKYRKIGFCCMALSLLFLVWVPIVNVWQIQSSYSNEFYSAIYSTYTIPLILASFAFFVLGITLIRYKKSQTINVHNLSDTKVVKQETFKQDSTGNLQEETTVVEKNNIDFKNLGFSLILFSQLSIIWAAIVYVQGMGLEFFPDHLSALPFIAIGVALFALGVASTLYKKPKKLGFLGVASGSATLITATFTYIHETTARYSFREETLLSYDLIAPYKDFALTFFLASIALFAVGYALMLRKPQKIAT